MAQELFEFLGNHESIRDLELSDNDLKSLVRAIEEDYLADFLASVIQASENIMAIDPYLKRQQILELAAEKIVDTLNAKAATIRLFEPLSLKMLAAGAFGFKEFKRVYSVPLQESIAGRVVQENRGIPVSSIMKDPLYKNKGIVKEKGFKSLLAVPIRIPSTLR